MLLGRCTEADADVVVQATTVGMGDKDARLPLVWPEGGGVAADVVISPPRTAFLRDAEAAGRSTATLDRVMARRRAVHARIMVEALGIDASMVNASL